jgi:hypothetical protein
MMRKRAGLIAVVASAVFLSGCFVVSVNPLFRERDLAFDPALVGTWTTPCSEENGVAKFCRLVFAAAEHKGYSIAYTDEKAVTVMFDGYLGRLGKNLYLDVVPQSAELKSMSGAARDHALLAHSFWKVSLKKDELTLASLRANDALQQALRRAGMRTGMTRTASGWESDPNLLLGSTLELQRFLAVYGAKPEAWDAEPAVWHKQ